MQRENSDQVTTGNWRVLHVGSGPVSPGKLHRVFQGSRWQEVRVDLDPAVKPDILLDISDMSAIERDSYEAIWCSHCLEHLDDHSVNMALREFRRVLKLDGFALITCPDLQAVAKLVADGLEERVAYSSPAGEVRPLDMMFGFRPAIAAGRLHMRHNTGFSCHRLGRLMKQAGFFETRVVRGRCYDLWAVGLEANADKTTILADLRACGLDFELDGST